MARDHALRRPHDATDLYLAPVTLAVDGRLQELGLLAPEALASEIAISTNSDAGSTVARERAVVSAVTYLLEMHGWNASMAPRGLRLSHGEHSVVLGLPRNVMEYLGR